MVVTYLLTILIVSAWVIRMISEKKFIFRRTILDIPLLIFLASQVISTLLSIDMLTSWLGYYSRFNGGLLSTISYLLLYWAFVSNIKKDDVKKIINVTLWSATAVAIYGVLEHFGIDKNIWQQDVQSRVFSTLGQPNWLAAWLVALIPITWTETISNFRFPISKQVPKSKTFKPIIFLILSLLFFVVLLFTKSRSGLIGFAAASLIFWFYALVTDFKNNFKHFLVFNISYLIFALVIGTQFTPSLNQLINKSTIQPISQSTGTALETGGTESGTIRKIVWQGAVQVWKHYPIFGTGVETFAYSYYLQRPAAHNLTSEWDYIYNKAHNEFLNIAANTGTIGLISYLVLIGFAIFTFIQKLNFPFTSLHLPFKSKNQKIKNEMENNKWQMINTALASGYTSILITNFFGFSVVPIQLLFFLYPAFAIILASENVESKEVKTINLNQKLLSWAVISFAGYLVFATCRYWYADYLYAKGSNYNRANRYDLAPKYLNQVVKLEPAQSIYYSELAKSYTNLTLAYNEAGEATAASQLKEAAIENAAKAVSLSPANVNLKRIQFGIFVMLSAIDPNYLLDAKEVLVKAIAQAPTDAKLHYNLGLIYSRIGENDLALETFKKTVEMKSNYKDARLAYAILLINANRKSEARQELEYILTNIDPADSVSKQYLESI